MTKKTPDAEKRKQIIERALALFFSRGVTPVSMEEIASTQGISKKTLYKFFPNKTALAEAAIENRMLEVVASASQVAEDRSLPFPQRLRGILGVVSRQIALLGQGLVQDISFNHPQLWERIDTFRREHVFSLITGMIEEGIRTGYIRAEIDSKLVPLLFINAITSVITPAQLMSLPYPPAQIFDAFFRILFGGILSEKARREFFGQEEKK